MSGGPVMEGRIEGIADLPRKLDTMVTAYPAGSCVEVTLRLTTDDVRALSSHLRAGHLVVRIYRQMREVEARAVRALEIERDARAAVRLARSALWACIVVVALVPVLALGAGG